MRLLKGHMRVNSDAQHFQQTAKSKISSHALDRRAGIVAFMHPRLRVRDS